MKQAIFNYVGDAAIIKLLAHYHCQVPFHVVRTRMLGNIATPRSDVSPVSIIKDLFGGELPEVDHIDELNDLLQELMGLWNHLVQHQSRTKPIRFLRTTLEPDRASILRFCQMRNEELEGFIDGLFGQEESLDFSEEVNTALSDLTVVNALMGGAIEFLESTASQHETEKNLAETVKKLKKLSISAGKQINTIILLCKRMRRSANALQPGERPTFH